MSLYFFVVDSGMIKLHCLVLELLVMNFAYCPLTGYKVGIDGMVSVYVSYVGISIKIVVQKSIVARVVKIFNVDYQIS